MNGMETEPMATTNDLITIIRFSVGRLVGQSVGQSMALVVQQRRVVCRW